MSAFVAEKENEAPGRLQARPFLMQSCPASGAYSGFPADVPAERMVYFDDPNAVGQTVRVLIVEDSAILALDLKDELAEAGHEVVAVAGSVGQADLVAPEAIDVAIVDVKLPDGSGYELARRLSRRGTRIVFASAGLASDVPSDLAAWPFLAKPYLTDSVRAALKAA